MYLVIGVVLIIVEEGQEGGVLEAALREWIREQEFELHHVHATTTHCTGITMPTLEATLLMGKRNERIPSHEHLRMKKHF